MDLEAQAQAALEAKQTEENKSGDKKEEPAKLPDDKPKTPEPDGAPAPKDQPVDAPDEEPAEDEGGANSLNEVELPERARFIYDNLPALVARGHLGKGAVKDFSVKTAQELPDKFEFASKRDELLFVQELTDQSQRANALDGQWQQRQQQANYDKWQEQQARDIASDLSDLQKEGLVPKFTEKEAKADPENAGVKLANDVYDYMQKTNTARANAGKPYFLSFRDAFEIVAAKKGLETKNQSNAQAQQERARVSAKVGGGQGTSRELKKPSHFKSVWDIVDLHDAELN